MADGGMTTEHITIRGNGGDEVDAYYAQPSGQGPFPGVVVLQHIFGVDEWIMEVCRRLAHHGYMALAPNLYARIGSLGSGPVEDLAARLRGKGGLNDDVVMGDIQGAMDNLRARPGANGKVGTIGFCMGGRFAYLAACHLPTLDAARRLLGRWRGARSGAAWQPSRYAADRPHSEYEGAAARHLRQRRHAA